MPAEVLHHIDFQPFLELDSEHHRRTRIQFIFKTIQGVTKHENTATATKVKIGETIVQSIKEHPCHEIEALT